MCRFSTRFVVFGVAVLVVAVVRGQENVSVPPPNPVPVPAGAAPPGSQPAVPYPGTIGPATPPYSTAQAPPSYPGPPPAYAPPSGGPIYGPPAYAPPPYGPPVYGQPVYVPPPGYPVAPPYAPPQTATADANVCVPVDAPHWLFSAEALWLERTDDRDVLLGNTVTNGGPTFVVGQLSSGDEWFPLEAGVRFQLGYRINDRDAIEGIYWGLQQWSVGRQINGDPIGESVLAFSPWTQTDTLIGGFDTSLGYTYKSRVNNVEINERFGGAGGVTWSIAGLWGIRYMQVADNFNLNGADTATGDFENIDIKTVNNLLGPQVGVEFIRDWGRFQLNTELKAGLFANFATERYSNLNSSGVIFGDPAGFVPVNVSHSATTTAGLFEFSIIGRWELTKHLWAKVAWNDYYIAGLALGPRQLGRFTSGGGISLDGPSVGLEAAW